MRTIIAGTRAGVTRQDIEAAIAASGVRPSVVLCGGASGADFLGAAWAVANGVPVEHYLADWNRYGRRAGPIRNSVMARQAQVLIAVWDGQSSGTRHMIAVAQKQGLKVYVYRPQGCKNDVDHNDQRAVR